MSHNITSQQNRYLNIPNLERVFQRNVSYSAHKPRFSTGSKNLRRAVLKNGNCNVLDSSKRAHFLEQDLSTIFIKMKWHWTILIFTLGLLASWIAFAALWWLVCYTHGDFEPNHMPDYQEQSNFTACVREVYGFMSCLLFSIETQHTVGYGTKATMEECPEAIFLNATQCTFGIILQGIMSGIIFAKMTLPKKRKQTLMFSKNAVICLRDGVLNLMFRVGDVRHKHIIDANVKVMLVKTTKTLEGELLRQQQTVIDSAVDDCTEDVPLLWPMIVSHKINKSSPLYDISPGNLSQNNFEIVAILDGVIESTGQSTQARTSYIPSEILWGCQFEPLLEFNAYWREYEVDFSKFHNVRSVQTPQCSAKELKQYDPNNPSMRSTFSFVIEKGFLKPTTEAAEELLGQQLSFDHNKVSDTSSFEKESTKSSLLQDSAGHGSSSSENECLY